MISLLETQEIEKVHKEKNLYHLCLLSSSSIPRDDHIFSFLSVLLETFYEYMSRCKLFPSYFYMEGDILYHCPALKGFHWA
jgi:hypothetical protein